MYNSSFLAETEEKLREKEIQDHPRPELRRSPEEKRLEIRKGDRISWGNIHRRTFRNNPVDYLFYFHLFALVDCGRNIHKR